MCSSDLGTLGYQANRKVETFTKAHSMAALSVDNLASTGSTELGVRGEPVLKRQVLTYRAPVDLSASGLSGIVTQPECGYRHNYASVAADLLL